MRMLELYPIEDDEGEGKHLEDRVVLTDDGKLEIPEPMVKDIVESLYRKLERDGQTPDAEEFFNWLSHWTNGYLKARELSV